MPFLSPSPERKKLNGLEKLAVNGTKVPESVPDAVSTLEAKVNGS